MPAPDDTAAPLPPKHMLDKASPALYEALVALLDWMERVTTEEGCPAYVAAAAADKAHAALALARGDSQ